MKKILLSLATFLQITIGISQNISTGITTWTVTPNGGNPTIIQPNATWSSQITTPVTGTQAQWIVPTGGSTQGDFIFEKKIQVGSQVGSLRLNFQLGVDDVLSALWLEKPGGTIINLGIPPLKTLTGNIFKTPVDTTLECPEKGDWKLKAKVQIKSDGVGGFLLSGTATLSGTCNPQPIYNTCCPPWNKEVLGKTMQYKGTGGISDPYTLVWNPSALFQSQMQAYLNYIGLLNQCVTKMSMEFRLHNQGTGATPNIGGWGPMIGSIGYVSFTKNTTGVSTLSNLPAPISLFPANGMLPNIWYAITTGIYHDCGQQFFGKDCAENTIYVRVQFMAAKGASSEGNAAGNTLEISDGKKIIANLPLL